MSHRLITLLLCTALFSQSSCKMTEEQSDGALWMGKVKEQMIKNASRGIVYHIAPSKAQIAGTDGDFLGYPVLSGPIDLGPEELLHLQQLLSDTSSYILDESFKMCLFTPNIGLRLLNDEQKELDLLLCFDCNVLKIYEHGQEVFSEDFDPGRDELLTIFYPIFKDMPYFQAMKSS